MKLLISFISIACVYGLNLPGNAPREYQQGDNVELRVSKLSSDVFQVPYEYYYLNFCPPENGITTSIDENLGQLLIGEALSNTAYRVRLSLYDLYQ
jgi:transmembrane 9 superfamily member 2/4